MKFQEIFALVLPDRDDRKIPLLDAADATNISLTIVNAVRDDQIPKDQWPQVRLVANLFIILFFDFD